MITDEKKMEGLRIPLPPIKLQNKFASIDEQVEQLTDEEVMQLIQNDKKNRSSKNI